MIPARWKRCQLCLNELQLVHNLRKIVAGLGGLAETEAVGIDLGHVVCAAVSSSDRPRCTIRR